MTLPNSAVVTIPYCGSCGRETLGPNEFEDLAADLLCDACGADLTAYGWTAGLLPPTSVVVVADAPAAGNFRVTYVENAGADTNTLEYQINGGATVTVAFSTSPEEVLGPFNSNDVITTQVFSVQGGVAGPLSTPVATDTIA